LITGNYSAYLKKPLSPIPVKAAFFIGVQGKV
jgi:hypothetical protein